MILSALLTTPALAEPVSGADKVTFGAVFGWWLPAPGAEPRPAVIGLHGCNGLYARSGELNARERGLTELLRSRGFHVLLPDSFTPRGLRELCTTALAQRTLRAADRRADIQGALDWLAARPDVDRTRIVVIGWSHGGSAVLAALNHRIGVQPLQARAAVAFYPGCSPYARTQGAYLPVAPLLILIGALDDWTPPAPCVELGKWTPKVKVEVFPGSYHGFDHPSTRVRVRIDVPNGVKRGEGVTVGSNPKAREQAYAALFEFLERELR
ncbi:MAG TPA: dienelactone hydrolase family protein [Burkholderiales bacterium]|jgi:dienelactone hydrolase|nr:dienelactone hydrolase family protein [Burkholderiales bacterium]